MNDHHIHIALISDNPIRIDKFSSLLQDAQNRISTFTFKQALLNVLIEEPFDIILVDCCSQLDFDYRHLEPIRMQKKLELIPFIFVLDPGQDTIKRQVYKKNNHAILLEPIDRFSFISAINNALHLGRLERRFQLYHEMVEGEKKLIHHLDELLEMEKIRQIESEQAMIDHLQIDFVRRLELTLAVETVLFPVYEADRKSYSINLFDRNSNQLVRRHTLSLSKSALQRSIQENFAQIFEASQLIDPFIQALEESLGLKIFGLLFIPITVFHQPKAAIILINKLYRDEFTENDLAVSLVAAQKITWYLEKMQTKERDDGKKTKHPFSSDQYSELLQQRKFYSQLMDSVNYGTILFNENFNVSYLNKAARLILTHTTEEQPVNNLNTLFDPDELNRLKTIFQNQSLPIVRQEIQLCRKNTPDFFIGFSIYPFEADDTDKKFILVFSEISQTKRIQAEIIRMDRMASLGILSAGIAHEVRNPLAGIKAMAQSLEDEIPKDSSQMEYVQRILRQVNRLDDLLRAFFSYAKPQRPDPNTCSIQKIVHEVLPLVKNKSQERDIALVESYADDLSNIFVDANQIEQVMLNLFINAIDAMPNGGKLTVSAVNSEQPQPVVDRRKRIPGLFSNRYIEIRISDTGSGIPLDIIDKVFNPFFTTKSNGTGLGLSIVYQIIKEHGGQIDVHSEVGKGTEFIIQLPALDKLEKG